MVPRLIAGGLIGAVAGVIIMMVAHSEGEREQNITELASTLGTYRVEADVTAAIIWGYLGLGLLVLGVLTAIAGLLIIAATKHDPS
jgi:hypothetical protein